MKEDYAPLIHYYPVNNQTFYALYANIIQFKHSHREIINKLDLPPRILNKEFETT